MDWWTVEGRNRGDYNVINPRHGKVMSSAKSSNVADVADAVEAAKVNLAEWQIEHPQRAKSLQLRALCINIWKN